MRIKVILLKCQKQLIFLHFYSPRIEICTIFFLLYWRFQHWNRFFFQIHLLASHRTFGMNTMETHTINQISFVIQNRTMFCDDSNKQCEILFTPQAKWNMQKLLRKKKHTQNLTKKIARYRFFFLFLCLVLSHDFKRYL